MSFRKTQWLFPAAAVLHNGEEAIWMPGWDQRHGVQLPVHPGAAEIRIALAILTVAAFAVTYCSQRRGPQSVWAHLMFGGMVAMLVNVFVPHVPAAIAFREYTPGVVTAVLINLPVMSMLVVQAVREEWVGGWKALVFGAGVPLTLAAMILALFRMSRG